ncbi:MAG: hypothetical protein Q4A00_04030 [Flavobacteriaceae bacterium]|nr:hypothetical protein [Flavobacteriaceae bacterium]
MKDKFITNEGVEIPLHKSVFTYVEENPRFKDSFWTNYTLPIDYYYTRDFLSQFGQYSSLSNTQLKRYHEGVHIFEGKPRKGKLEIMEFKKDMIKFQIDSGFETLPNFDTQLKDLPLLDIKVEDIYHHANEVVSKKYPDTDYNFPKLYTDEYNLEEEAYKYFDSMINNRTELESRTGKEFTRNRLENNEMDVYNKNIIHPLPYLLYVLKVGFRDAGFRLEGDILEDEFLKQRLIWSGQNYHHTGEQKEHKINIFQQEFVNMDRDRGNWEKRISINAPGRYRLLMKMVPKNNQEQWKIGTLDIYSDKIESLSSYPRWRFNKKTQSHQQEFLITPEEAEAGAEIVFFYGGVVSKNQYDNEGKNIGVMQININPIRQHTKEGQPIPYIFNENRVNLKKAVPEMSFGELVTTIKNLRNYDLVFDGNKAIMNTIRLANSQSPMADSELVDFRMFEVENPLRMFNEKVSFNIAFPDSENVEIKNIYIDEKGYHINYKNIPTTATEININVMTLPLTMFRGAWTAKALKESALMLVYYDGLNEHGDNHAQNPPGLMDEPLAKHLYPWFKNRLTNFVYKWTFITEKNKIRKFNIRSEIFCYGRRHLIKSWTKKSLSETLYAVEIETETY